MKKSPSFPGYGCTLLAFGAHPDDIELSVGGTISKTAKAGHRTVAAELTGGESGTRGSSGRRLEESRKAAKILGLAAVAGHRPASEREFDESLRLQAGPAAFAATAATAETPSPEDWPTYRYDAARHASTPTSVPVDLSLRWTSEVGGRLTAP